MTRIFYSIIALSLLFGCKSAEQKARKNQTLITIDGTTVPTDEFLYVYSKNNFNSDTAYSEEDVKEYLDLYINFKLKVKEAEEKGLHETEGFKEELEGYRKQLAKPYLTETSVTDSLVKEAYERLKTEINASHILLTLPANASPEDTLKTLKAIKKLKERALKGEDFATLAKEFSEDPSAKVNAGNLGYFTALQMVYPFEDAAYKTPEGSISEPVRTRFGYHIIKVDDKRPSQGKVKVSHIMVRATQGISAEDSIAARNEIFEIHKQLENDADWFEMASQYSDDISSKSSGGELPWFGTGNMIPEFEQAAFSLNDKGDFSEPVKTAYGWHIIKLDDKQGLESFEDLRANLEMKVSKDSRAELNSIALIKRLKEENNFVEFQDTVDLALEDIDSTLLLGNWSYASENQLLAETLFKINDKSYAVKDFYDYVAETQAPQQNISRAQYLNLLYQDFVEGELIAYEEKHLDEKYEDYKMLYKEYRDGILLFELMDEKVWSKAVEDTTGLKRFYDANRADYQWKERADAVIIATSDKAVVDSIRYYANQEHYPTEKKYSLSLQEQGFILNDENKLVLDSLAELLLADKQLLGSVSLSDKAGIDKITSYLAEEGVTANQLLFTDGKTGTIKVLTQSKKWLEKHFNRKNALLVQVEEGKFEKQEHPVLAAFEWRTGEHTLEHNGKSYHIVINEIIPPTQKAFNSIRGQVISDYQNHLEKEWVNALRSRYTVDINEDALENVLEQLENQ